MRIPVLSFICLCFIKMGDCEVVQSLAIHTRSCFNCGMVEGLGYITIKVCGDTNCCLSRSLNNDNVNWVPGQTDTYIGSDLLECDQYSIGLPPFTVTAFHDGTDSVTLDWIEVRTDKRTVMCSDLKSLDNHSWVKSDCV